MSKTVTRTGNIAADAITAVLNHYKLFHKKVSVIYLSHGWWKKFSEYAKEVHPEFNFDDTIEFNNVTVKKGSVFMIDNLKVELVEDKAVLN